MQDDPKDANADSGNVTAHPNQGNQTNLAGASIIPSDPAGNQPQPTIPVPPSPTSSQANPDPEAPLPNLPESVLALLAPSDPGPVPPATSMNFTPGQVGGPTSDAHRSIGTSSMASAPIAAQKRTKSFLFGIIVLAIITIAAAFFFVAYWPNTPGQVYKSSIANSGIALDKLVEYSKQQEHSNYTTSSFAGSLHSKAPAGSYDISINGAFDRYANANMHVNADVMGDKLAANILTIKSNGSSSPDVYFQITGIKSLLDSLGLNNYDYLDGKWIMIDHTLINTYISSTTNTSQHKSNSSPTYAEFEDAISKVQLVNKQYLFSTNSGTAVLTNQKFIAKEASGGRLLDHYKVGYNRAHLSAYLSAVTHALNSSQLNTWYKSVSNNKNLSDELKIPSLQHDLKSAPDNYTFDLWADTKTKVITKISFTDPSNKSAVFSIGQNYTGGSTYPFVFGYTGKNSSGNPEAASLNFSIDTKTNKANVSFTSNATSSSGITNISGNLSETPSDTPVNVRPPQSVESFTNLLLSLGFSSATSININTPDSPQPILKPLAITEGTIRLLK